MFSIKNILHRAPKKTDFHIIDRPKATNNVIYSTENVINALSGLHFSGPKSERDDIYKTLTRQKTITYYDLPRVKNRCTEALKSMYPKLGKIVEKNYQRLVDSKYNLEKRRQIINKMIKEYGEKKINIPEGFVDLYSINNLQTSREYETFMRVA